MDELSTTPGESFSSTLAQAHAILHQPFEPVTLQTGTPDMHRLLLNLDAKMTAGFNGLSQRLSSMEESIRAVAADVNHLKSGMNILESNLETVKTETIPALKKELESRIKDLEKARLESELYSKKNNLLFFDIPHQQEEDTEKALLTHLHTIGIPDLDTSMFAVVHRLPPKQNSNKPHPIIAKFNKIKERNRILNHKPPHGTKFAVAPHLPALMQEKRRNLVPIRNQLKREGKNAKIRVRGTEVQLLVNNEIYGGGM